jgi:hypothetical protein
MAVGESTVVGSTVVGTVVGPVTPADPVPVVPVDAALASSGYNIFISSFIPPLPCKNSDNALGCEYVYDCACKGKP